MFNFLKGRKKLQGIISDLKNGDKFRCDGVTFFKEKAIVVEPSNVDAKYTHIICADRTFHLLNTTPVIIFRRAA